MSKILLPGVAQAAKNSIPVTAANTLLNDLVACWEMDETSGTVMNDSHGTHDGTITGGVTVGGNSFVSTELGKSYNFAGTDPQVVVPSHANLYTSAFSFGIWVKMAMPTDATLHAIVTGAGGSGASSGWRLNFDKYGGGVGGRIRLESGNGSAANSRIEKTELANDFGQKMFLVVTYDGTDLKLYYNGTLVGTLAVTIGWSSSPELWDLGLGIGGGLTDFVGDMDEPLQYSRAITQEEVTLLWNDGNGMPYSGFGSSSGGVTSTAPTVTTNAVINNVTDTTAESGGNVTDDGNDTVTEKGVVISTATNPDITDTKIVSGSGKGSYTSQITGLTPSTTYYLRAFATNSVGTSYGSEVIFQTEAEVIQNTLLNNLVSLWEFNETSGTAEDAHGSRSGQVSGNVTRGVAGPGNLGTAYRFAPLDPAVQIASAPELRASVFSFSIWAKMALPTDTARHSLVTGAGGSGYSNGWRLAFDKYLGGRIVFECGNNAATPTRWTISAQDLSAAFGQWMKILATYDGDTVKLYVNNVLKASESGVNIQYATDAELYPLRIGESGGQTDFEGDADQPAYWNKVVTVEEENDLWADGNGKPYTQFGSTAPTVTKPTVSTYAITNITENSATSGGNVSDDGGDPVVAKGVCYSKSSNPTLADFYTQDGSGTGSFTSNLSGLDPESTYYVRAYATNGQGTSYGNEVQFNTGEGTGTEDGEPFYTGTAYYFANDGNDANAGTSSASPKQTIGAANSLNLSPGDAILFKRGHSFDGRLDINLSGTSANRVVIGAYGTGNKPKIMGSREVTGWSHYSGNIYRAPHATEPPQLFLNGIKMRLARYQGPNQYSFITSSPSDKSDTFTSNEIDGNVNHVGAICYLRAGYYQSPVYPIVSQSGQTLTMSEVPGERLPTHVGNGFLLMGKLEYLTRAGEWVYKDGYIYFWTPNGDSPSNYSVRASVDSFGINMPDRSYVNVIGLEIAHQKFWGIYATGGSYHLIENNSFLYNEENGYRNTGSTSDWGYNFDLTFRNNFFKGQNGLGIYTYHSVKVMVEENEFREIGVLEEIGKLGHGEKDTWGSGFEISQPNNPYVDPNTLEYTFRYNDFYDICYNGFFWRGKATIYRNFFNGVCKDKQDGAAIYNNTQGHLSHIYENIVLNALGNVYGYYTTREFAAGIYSDEICEYVLIEYNTCIDSGEAGVKFHRNKSSIARYNNILNARTGVDVVGRTDADGTEDIEINNNVIVQGAKDDNYFPNRLLIWTSNSPTGGGAPQYNSNNNKFVYPFTGIDMFKDTTDYRTFAEWQAAGNDGQSTLEQTALGAGESYQCFYNKSKVQKTYNVTGDNVKDVDQNAVSQFTLDPYRSIILRGANIVVTEI